VAGEAFTASNTFSVSLQNVSAAVSNMTFSTSDIALSGGAASGVSVSSVTPSLATIQPGESQLITYSLSGTPSNRGLFTIDWSIGVLSCRRTVTVSSGDANFSVPKTEMVISVSENAVGVDIQGVIDNGINQITVDIPYTDGVGTYDAFTGFYVSNNTGTAEGSDANKFRLSYPAGTFSASGHITATVEVDGDGTFNAQKQLFRVQKTIATLDFQVNGNSKGVLNLDVFGGIQDRNIANAQHKFLYIPVKAKDGKTWLNNNLGANYSNINHTEFNPLQQATGDNDHHAYGSKLQWGRYSDGHDLINYSSATVGTAVTTTTSSSHAITTTPNNSIFYLADDSPITQDHNWLDFGASPNATEDGLWQGESGVNNPCPEGYRLPTETEIGALISAEGIINPSTAASSTLALSYGGHRVHTNGDCLILNVPSYYWTSTVSGFFTRALFMQVDNINFTSDYRANGFAVRCIKE
ncbi:MAG: hypothetical protein HRT67_07095, partial [Flavobacteriaceae bacterium]|nr:hypothetical protein [Flavobacteriaceae bacterium]